MSNIFPIFIAAIKNIKKYSSQEVSDVDFIVDGGTMLLSKENYDPNTGAPSNTLYSQNVMYRDGQTYHAFQRFDDGRITFMKLSEYGMKPPHIIKGNINYHDSHDRPVFRWQGDRLHLIQEDGHDTFNTTIHRAVSDDEDFAIDSNVAVIPTYPTTYPNHYNLDGKLVIIHQRGKWAAYAMSNSLDITDETQWTAADDETIELFNTIYSDDEDQRYQPSVYNKDSSPDYGYFTSWGRRSTIYEEPRWHRGQVFKMRPNVHGFLSFYTVDGRLIHESTGPGNRMDESQAEMAKYFDCNDASKTCRIPQNTLDENANFYSLHEDGTGSAEPDLKSSGNLVLSYWMTNSTTPVNQILTLPDNPTLVSGDRNQTGSGAALYVRNGIVNFFAKVDNGTRTIIHHYKTSDLGQTVDFVQEIDFGFDVSLFKLPENINQIPDNQSFLAVAGDPPGGTSGQGDGGSQTANAVALKRVAFTGFSAESNIYDSLSLINETEYNSNALFSYQIESGKINNTGTSLTQLLDQSANNKDITVNGNPVLDDSTTPTQVTFDGNDDYASLDPALLTSGRVLILAVIDSLGNTVAPVSISNNAATNEFINPQLRADNMRVLTAYGSSILGNVQGDDTPNNGYNICAWLLQDQGGDIPMWLNGRMQMRVVNEEPERNSESRYDQFPITNFEIGRLVRGSYNNYNFKLKSISAHIITSEKEILDRVKYLGDKYNITLNNAYR
ncbi:hypothetical protein ML462_14115 [Gramella lutea]|uniref:Uncharacterized protein n=1 Tax=Christiangramia lutea TaxID=1607951 RepID=A0A9X2ACB5_9FLAO|nr:hypothetical protein [Christiangramia lutea]MCH4824307.1 hypothetical protein [Christiangramia lutea]